MQCDRLAVIGDPIDHTLSPRMHAAALEAAGLPWVYDSIRVPADRLASHVAGFRPGPYRGFNVTIPHKLAIRALLDGEVASARRAGAVNTVVRAGQAFIGHNTDIAGFTAALLRIMPEAARTNAIVFGAGGGARAAVAALSDLRAHLLVVSRNAEHGRDLAAEFAACWLSPEDPRVPGRIRDARLLINATPLGMAHLATGSPLPAHADLDPESVLIDLVYGRRTPFLEAGRARGCRVDDGLEMLVQQGAEALRLWADIEPDLEVMRAACHARVLELQRC